MKNKKINIKIDPVMVKAIRLANTVWGDDDDWVPTIKKGIGGVKIA